MKLRWVLEMLSSSASLSMSFPLWLSMTNISLLESIVRAVWLCSMSMAW